MPINYGVYLPPMLCLTCALRFRTHTDTLVWMHLTGTYAAGNGMNPSYWLCRNGHRATVTV